MEKEEQQQVAIIAAEPSSLLSFFLHVWLVTSHS
jgi:hypothetical protein